MNGISRRVRWAAILIAIIYGLVTRLLFGARFTNSFFNTLTLGFLVGVPLVLGALTVYLSPKEQRTSQGYALKVSFTTGLIFLVIVFFLTIEAFICILMAAPIFMVMSILGGAITCWILRKWAGREATVNSLIVLLVIAPYFVSPIESRFAPQESTRTVENSIVIEAEPAVIWRNIIRVPAIGADEQYFMLFQVFGIPKPLEATLESDGVRMIRTGRFEHGLTFKEIVTDWQPLQTVSFTIQLDTSGETIKPFDQIGGEAFEMIDATYTLEPLDSGQIRLHLSSRHRLTTRFNGYGGLWTDLILHNFQDYILNIVKGRAESQ